ncbi:MAG TPA: superoxide dismutase family protein [Sphingomonas sp.]|nr:superoxide dismutase family protein [Sphingomonas sp.]
MIRSLLFLTLSVALAGAAQSASRPYARATLKAADGASRGAATLSDTGRGLSVRVQAQGLAPGVHGIHVHTVGRCDPPDFQSAGAHWNPAGRQHGRDNPQGQHRGDLPSVNISANGRGKLNTLIPGATLADLLDADGAALVIHANPDDYRTDPSGNSGGRIACGVIERSY